MNLDDFEEELQGKLNQISHRRSNKKIPLKKSVNSQEQYRIEVEQYEMMLKSLQRNNKQIFNRELKDSRKSKASSQDKIQIKQILKSEKKQESYSNSKYKTNNNFPSTTNEQLQQFIEDHMSQAKNLDLSYFLAKCLSEFSDQGELSEQQIKLIFLQLQEQATTVDQNLISLNALEISIRKKVKSNSFRMYIFEKILKAKIKTQEKTLNQNERQFQIKKKEYEEKSKRTKNELQQLKADLYKRQKLLEEKQKQHWKRQKNWGLKQKQFQDKLKTAKKTIQQQSQKLFSHYANQINLLTQKIKQKINQCQRNMKYKIEALSLKVNQIHRLRQFRQGDIRKQINKETQQKYQKSFNNKNKKMQSEIKQLETKCENLKKEMKQYQEQNNKLAKIYHKLQSKHLKQQSKVKQLSLALSEKNNQVKELQQICTLKQNQNEELMKKIFSKPILESKIKVQKQEANKNDEMHLQNSKQKKKPNKKKSFHEGKSPKQQIKDSNIVQVYQQVFDILYSKQSNKKTNSLKNLQFIIGQAIQLFFKQFQCQNLIKFIFTSITNLIKTQSLNQKKILQISHLIPHEQTQLVKSILSKINKNFKYDIFTVWKICGILYLMSDYKQNTIWLHYLNNLTELSHIQQKIENEEKQIQIMMIAISLKVISSKNNQSVAEFLLFSELIISCKSFLFEQNQKFWREQGQRFFELFTKLVEESTVNIQYFEQHIQQIERISIMIQRLVTGFSISVNQKQYQILLDLQSTCQGTLLERNLKSITSLYEENHSRILQDLSNSEIKN